MNKLLIGAGILFVLIIFSAILNILSHVTSLSDFTRGYTIGYIMATLYWWLVKRVKRYLR
jgi:hypothetical protein